MTIFSNSKLLLLTLCICSASASSFSQATSASDNETFKAVYLVAKEKYGYDPLLLNGIYYENPYYNAKGHPFLGDGEFHKGTVMFRNKRYEDVSLKFDVYHQQLIINHHQDDEISFVVMDDRRIEGMKVDYDPARNEVIIREKSSMPVVMNLLTIDFVSEFSIKDMYFRKMAGPDDDIAYYQVIAEYSDIQCVYHWNKNRYKSQAEGDFTKYIFSESKPKMYLIVDGVFFRYNNNRSFIRAIPESSKADLRDYLKVNKIKVKEAGVYEISTLLRYCQNIL